MGRPRGKSKKAIEAASNDDEDGSAGEEVPPPTPKRRGRPQTKPLTDEAEDKDTAEAEEDDADGTKPVVMRPSNKDSAKQDSAEGGGKKRRRRREDEAGHVRSSRSNGFRPNGSRRKSTPRRAAEAGVECK